MVKQGCPSGFLLIFPENIFVELVRGLSGTRSVQVSLNTLKAISTMVDFFHWKNGKFEISR